MQEAIAGLLDGATYDGARAKALGLLIGMVPAEDLHRTATDWLPANADVQQPWMARGFRGPGGTAGFERFFHGLNARFTRDRADKRPERRLIAEAVYHELQMPIEPALHLETRRFIELTRNPSARDAMQKRFFGQAA
ncbi:hypothetical protein KO516_18370 [Citreicella sp. C3M06]|uniref:hypothetical protein n=1 Tax=Citreicella sp. C3M06 TaxID=2841564 RepID=UPI001C09B5CE|nr:hypothetical protein [Citreicella sp. C3M06]MBU2962757.1 hypothetical protein [Citreicella sp. C3M06]